VKRHHLIHALPVLVPAGLLLAQLVSADPLPNAWQITDSASNATPTPPSQQTQPNQSKTKI
jgi:hypothetical protein